jgi:outer membrane lipoprotein-sorting protein
MADYFYLGRKNSMKHLLMAAGLLLLLVMLCPLSACGESTTTTTSSSPTTQDQTTTPTTTTPTKTTPDQTTTPTSTTSTETTTPATTTTEDPLAGLLSKWTGSENVRYDLHVVSAEMDMTGKIWQKAGKQRAEYIQDGQTIVMIFLLDEEIMYSYMPDQNTATKMALDTNQLVHGTMQGDMQDVLNNDPVITGTEEIDGKSCTVITFTSDDNDITLWVWTETGFPLRTEAMINGEDTVMEFLNVDFSDIDDSVFELPEGTQIIEM